MKKNLILICLFAAASTSIWAQRTTPIKTVERPATKRTAPPKNLIPSEVSGEPTLTRALEGHLTINPINNFERSPSDLPKGLTATRFENGLPRWIEGTLPTTFKAVKTTEERAFQYLSAVGKVMKIENPADEFEIMKTETDDIGQTHVRMRRSESHV